MRGKIGSLFILAALFAGVVGAAETKVYTTRARLAKYGEDLRSAWEQYPARFVPPGKTADATTDPHRIVRQKMITDLNSAFTNEIKSLEAPKGETLQKVVNVYLTNLEGSISLLPSELMKPDRASYTKGCGEVFKREYGFATDYGKERTTQQCYDLLMDLLEQIRDRLLHDKYKEIRTQSSSDMNALFGQLLNAAQPPKNTDHLKALDDNIKEARRRFIGEKNKPIVALLEAAAKKVQEKAVRK